MSSILKDVVKLLDESRVDGFLHDLGVRRKSSVAGALGTFGLFAAGVAVGAAAGLLLAPKTGEEMRDDLFAKVNEFREEFGSRFQSVMNQGERYNPPS
jgi:hypothetical protein